MKNLKLQRLSILTNGNMDAESLAAWLDGEGNKAKKGGEEIAKAEGKKLKVFFNQMVICERTDETLKDPDVVNGLKELFEVLFGTKSILDASPFMKLCRQQFSIDYNLIEAYEGGFITDEAEKLVAEKELQKYEEFRKNSNEFWNDGELDLQKALGGMMDGEEI